MAGVWVTSKQLKEWKDLPIRDCKVLTPKQLKEVVEGTQSVKLHIIWIQPKEIDSANLNDLEAKAVWDLLYFHQDQTRKYYIDCPDPVPKKFVERLEKLGLTEQLRKKLIVENHADENYKVCSLASCHAKYLVDKYMEEMKVKYGDFGSANPNDKKTEAWLKANAIQGQRHPLIRYSWWTLKRLGLPYIDKTTDKDWITILAEMRLDS